MGPAPRTWQFDQSDGQLSIRTGVEGPAAKMGHRLGIAMNNWKAEVTWSAGEPAALSLTVDVESLEVRSGEGGVTPLTGPEKTLARSNALKALDVKRFPQIAFDANDIRRISTGYRLAGAVQLHGTERECMVDLQVDERDDVWHMSGEVVLRQTDFGIKPYSMLMGAMRVTDAVTVQFTAERARDR
jgi:polyisoprenoid-binding protein YceI